MLALPLTVVVHLVSVQSAALRVETAAEEEEMETTTTKETAMTATSQLKGAVAVRAASMTPMTSRAGASPRRMRQTR
jgi:hypothetical protein